MPNDFNYQPYSWTTLNNPYLGGTAPDTFTLNPNTFGSGGGTGYSPSTYGQMNQFLGSPMGQLAIGGLGAGLSAYANSKSQQNQLQSNKDIANAQLQQQYQQMLAELSQSLTSNAFNRAQSTLNARPLGAAQQYAASTGAQNAALDFLQNGPIRPGNARAAASMGNVPTISPDTLAKMRAALSPEATQTAIAQRDSDILGVNPSATTNDLSAYFGSPGQQTPLMQSLASGLSNQRKQSQGQLDNSESYARALLQRAIDGGNYGPPTVGGPSAATPFTQRPSAPPAAGASPTTSSGGASGASSGVTATGQPDSTTAPPSARATAADENEPARPAVAATPQTGAVARATPAPWQQANGKPEWGDTYWAQMTNPEALTSAAMNPDTHKAHDYYGGTNAPRVDQLTSTMQYNLQKSYGVNVSEDDVKDLVKKGWTYGKPAPDGYEYDRHTGLLQEHHGAWGKVANIAAIAAPIAATVLTGGAASPWLVASIGAGTGALASAANGGGLRGALIGGALGAAGGALGASSTGNLAAMTGKQVALNAAEQAGLGAARGALQGGGVEGALKGAAFGAAGAGLAGAAGNLAPAGAPLAQRIAAQAGTQAAFGGLVGGERGALMGAASGALGAGLNTQALDPSDKRRQLFALMAQRAPQMYNAVS